MKAYKMTVLIIDHDGMGAEDIKATLENQRFLNHCISPNVKAVEEVDIGEWTDNHPLNRFDTADAEFERLFSVKS